MESFIIGIAGGSGSGKTTFANNLLDRYGNGIITIIHYDDYYKSNERFTLEERKNINYDHPDAFDKDLLIADIIKLKKGNSIYSPVYDFKTHSRKKQSKLINPTPIIIVEGILVLFDHLLRKYLDLKIFVDVDADERALRRIVRDVHERGRTLNDVCEQYLNTVKIMHYRYVEPSKAFADIILNGGMNKKAVALIESYINKVIEGEKDEKNKT